MDPTWRPMKEADLSAVIRIAAAAHVGLEERADVFAEKLRLSPQGCLALDLGGEVLGYIYSHPWKLGDAPALDAFLDALPAVPDCLYLHDLALDPRARGHGAPAAAVARLVKTAEAAGLEAMALVAVRGTGPFWTRHRFVDAPDGRLAAKLAAYGADARYMVRRL